MAEVVGAYMAEARSFTRRGKALADRCVGNDLVPSGAAVFAHLAPAVVVGVGAYVKDQSILHDFMENGLDAFGNPHRPRDSVFRCFDRDDDAGEGRLVEVDLGAGHRPKLFAVPHAGIGQHRRNQAGVRRAVGK